MDKNKPKQLIVLMPTIEMLTHRPELATVFLSGIQGVLPIFKTKYKEAITDFLVSCEKMFFDSLNQKFTTDNPLMPLPVYHFGQTVLNGNGASRYIVGVGVSSDTNNKGKLTVMYEYYDPNLVIVKDGRGREVGTKYGVCFEGTMQSWSKK